MKRMRLVALVFVLVLVVVLQMGCANLLTEELVGGALGAGTGAIIGHQSGYAAEGALAGGLFGGLLGSKVRSDKIEATAEQANTRIVRVPSSDGKTFAEVVLRRHPSGWIVPITGEIFETEPTAEQLKARGYGPR